MTNRQATLLLKIIDHYIERAEPISSQYIVHDGFWGLSPATVRNDMNYLEQVGYLLHRHTSGGRIPTEKGYRYFVDELLSSDNDRALKNSEKYFIKEALQDSDSNIKINKAIADSVAKLSGTGVITRTLDSSEIYKTGLSSLCQFPEFKRFEEFFPLVSLFDQFESFFDKFERIVNVKDDIIHITIGRENPITNAKDSTIITAEYSLPYGQRGLLTLIGPMRMDYAKNVALISCVKTITDNIAKNYE